MDSREPTSWKNGHKHSMTVQSGQAQSFCMRKGNALGYGKADLNEGGPWVTPQSPSRRCEQTFQSCQQRSLCHSQPSFLPRRSQAQGFSNKRRLLAT